MTEALQRRLSSNHSPFTKTVLIVERIRKNLLFPLFEKSIRAIETASGEVLLSHDWLEHDGFITTPRLLSIEEVRSQFSDLSALEKASPGDFRVKLLFQSVDFELVFRIYFLKEDDDSEIEDDLAAFDLIADEKLLDEVAAYLNAEKVPYLLSQSAEYFKGLEC